MRRGALTVRLAIVVLSAIAVLAAACSSGSPATSTSVPGAAQATPPGTQVASSSPTLAPGASASPTSAPGVSSSPAPAPGAQVTEQEFTIEAPAQLPAGDVTFAVANAGSVAHNFWVIRTDLPADQLPLAGGRIDIQALDVVTNTASHITPGETAQVRAALAPGKYVLICNVPGHYQLGMRTAVQVR